MVEATMIKLIELNIWMPTNVQVKNNTYVHCNNISNILTHGCTPGSALKIVESGVRVTYGRQNCAE